MKKNIFIFILGVYLLFGYTSFANDCKIASGPDSSLDTYIKNINKIYGNITTAVSKNTQKNPAGFKKDFHTTKSKVTQVFNNMLDWSGYYSYFDFYVTYSLTNDYVGEIWRDYQSLETSGKNFEKYLKYITKQGGNDITLPKDIICAGIVGTCNFDGKVLDVIGKVIQSHEAMKDYYRLSIVGKKSNFQGELQLIDENFMSNFGQAYNENTTSACSQKEGGNFDTIKKEIKNIANFQKNTQEGMKSWKDAVALLDGSKSQRDMEAQERKIFEIEMNRNGTSMNSSFNLNSNLKKYNETGSFSLDNNFITNSFNSIKESVTSQINSFRDSITQNFTESKSQSIPVQKAVQTKDDLVGTKNVELIIKELYYKELPSAQLQDKSTIDLQSKIIEMHFNLTQGIHTLDKTCRVSQKVCDDQANGMGKCDERCN